MDKGKYLNKIVESAKLYQANLESKNFILIFDKTSKEKQPNYASIETIFLKRNFMHLTGISTKLNASDFYRRCVNGKLSASDFEIPNEWICAQKMSVLPMLFNFAATCRMLGNFQKEGIFLQTKKLVGGVKGLLGFVESSQNDRFYAPNTALSADIRNYVEKIYQILAIAKKGIKDKSYQEICYVAKNANSNEIKQYMEFVNMSS